MLGSAASIAISAIPTIMVVLAIVLFVRFRGGGKRTCSSCGKTCVPRDPYVIYCPSCGKQIARDVMISGGQHEQESSLLFRRLVVLMLLPFLLVLGGAAWLVMLAMKSWQ